MRADLSVRLVKELKGAPLSVLMALMLAGRLPVSQDWLARNTGYTDKPIHQALAYLFEHGFAARSGSGWVLADGVSQPPAGPTLDIAASDSQDAGLARTDALEPDSDWNSPNRNNSDSPISIIKQGSKDSDDSINTNSDDRKNSDQPSLAAEGDSRFSDFPELGDALMGLGIRENRRTRRLLGRITSRDVRITVAKIRDDPFHDLSETGLMVTMLEGLAERNERRGGYQSWNAQG